MSFSTADAAKMLDDGFAPWVRQLNLSFDVVEPDRVVMRMPFADDLCREGGIICGQAFMSLADTAAVFGLFAAAGGFRPCTTVEMGTQMMRPISNADVLATTEVLRLGRTMAFVRVTMTADGDPRPAVHATTTLALL